MRRAILPVLAVSALALASCGSNDAPEPSPEPVAVSATPSPSATPEPTPEPDPVAELRPFTEWVAEAYAGTTFVDHVVDAEARSGTLWIITSLYPDADADEPAAKLCSAGRAYVLDNEEAFSLGDVYVRAESGMRLAKC